MCKNRVSCAGRHSSAKPHQGNPATLVLEAYPRLVADALGGRNPYKSDKPKTQTEEHRRVRQLIVEHLSDLSATRKYGVYVDWADGLTTKAVADATGDVLDAVLCAVQAAWGWTRREYGFGVPADCDLAEGWIVDPANT